MRHIRKRIILDFAFPLLILIGLTVAAWLTNADIGLEKLFYSPESGWFLEKANPWRFLYDYGNIPALILLLTGILVFVLSLLFQRIVRYRKIALFVIVLMALGPGLIINVILKGYWGRHRPQQIEIFGGTEKTLAIWEKGVSGRGKSFPSGHASMGFFLFSPFFLLRTNAKGWAVFFLLLGIGYGILMGIARMVQGGHFASDVLWAGGFTYLTGITLYYLFRFDKDIWWRKKPREAKSGC